MERMCGRFMRMTAATGCLLPPGAHAQQPAGRALAANCYSTITTSSASWATSVLAYQDGFMVTVPSSGGEALPTSKNCEQMFGWARNLWADTLG